MLNFSAEWSLTDMCLHLWAATTSIMYVKSCYVDSKKKKIYLLLVTELG